MTMLDDVKADEESPAKKVKYMPKRAGNTVLEVEMPQRPPELGESAVADTRKVRLMARTTNQLWMAVEDVEWLINYVATEVALGGVPQVKTAAVADSNCEIKDLRVQWDFGTQSWRA